MGLLYVAHGQTVSLIENRRGDRTILPSQQIVEGNNPITLMRSYNNMLYCFAGNRIFLYSETGQYISTAYAGTERNESVLCVFEHPEVDTVYMVYPGGIYVMYGNDPTTFRLLQSWASTITSACQFGNFFAITFSDPHSTILVFKSTDTGFSRVVHTSLRNLTTLNVNGAYLFAPREGNKFNLITRHNWIVRFSIAVDDSSSEEESESSNSSESEEEEEPARDASGGGPPVGSKRRQTLDKDDPAYERKRRVMLQRALQFLTKEEREAFLKAPQELLDELYAEECAVCMKPLNTEGVQPITSECDHTICEDCETGIRRTDPRCPTCREPWRRATLEMLLI